MVALFVRMRGRENEGPKYRFNTLEDRYFQCMIRTAHRIHQGRVRRQGRDRPGSSGNEGQQNRPSTSGSSSSSNSQKDEFPAVRLIGLPVQCLRFCMALLSRKCRHGGVGCEGGGMALNIRPSCPALSR